MPNAAFLRAAPSLAAILALSLSTRTAVSG